MNSNAFGQKELEHLRRLQRAYLPGNLLAAIGIPVLVVVLMLLFLLFCYFLPRTGSTEERESAPPPAQQAPPQKAPEPPSRQKARPQVAEPQPQKPHVAEPQKPPKQLNPLGLCALFVFCGFGLIGASAIFFFRSKLNAAFVAKNRINLNYDMPKNAEANFNKLLECLDNLARTQMLEIVPRDNRDEYEHVADIALRIKSPKYLRCNFDIYCLVIGNGRYHLLPDCLLWIGGGDCRIVPWSEVSIKANNLNGRFRTTEQQRVMVHGRIKKDGGYDQRYNTRFATIERRVWKPIGQYDDLSLRFGKNRYFVLVAEKSVAPQVEILFNQWARIEAPSFRS